MDGGEVGFEKVEKEQKLSINEITLLGEELKDFVTTLHKLYKLGNGGESQKCKNVCDR